ncbi:LD-carboxypeptidase [Pirellulales bacterium]|nr:LD-carboxypeptidase [Pirellulales bacterium]
MESIIAKALERGDAISLVAPSGPVDRGRIEKAIAAFDQAGFSIKTYRDIYATRGYLAGDDQSRGDELMEAFCDPDTAAVFPARGGTGLTRIVDRLDYDVIRNHPKILTGFSDITALHLAVNRMTGLVTFHSPNPMDGFGHPEGFTELSERTFWRTLLADEYRKNSCAPWSVPLTDDERDKMITYSPGTARGRLIGGNLALVCSLAGTPYEMQTEGSILLIEDIGERPYRVDRFLSQLNLSGKLAAVRGVVLGQFTDCEPEDGKRSLSLDEIFDDYFANLGVPVLRNFPTGHARDNATLPLGIEVELNSDERVLTILENPVRV